MLRIGVLVSGGGTNLQAIIDRMENGGLPGCTIACVVSNKENAFALERAKKHNIKGIYVSKKEHPTIDEYDTALISHFEQHGVELVVMAGFLCLLGERFIKHYENRIINVHPSLIPSFCGNGYYGLFPHQKALEYGVKVTGATVHFVELEADAGPIILQKAVYIQQDDTPETLQKRVMEEAEWYILPEAIKLYAEGRIRVEGRSVVIKN